MKLLKKTAITLCALAASAIGCNNYESLCEQKLKDKGFTQEQAQVLTAASYRTLLMDEVKNNDGTVTYNVNYGAITQEDILTTVKQTHTDLKDMIDPKNFESILDIKFLLNTGLGKHLIKQEEVFRYLEDSLTKEVLQRNSKS